MGTRLTVTIETDLNIDDLRRAVAELDELESGPGEGIAPENVTAWDVLMMAATGSIGLVPLVYVAGWDPESGLPDLSEALAEAGGDMHKAFDGVVRNEMEPI